MTSLKSYAGGEWKAGTGAGRIIRNAITGEEIATCSSEGVDFRAIHAE